MPFPRGRAAPWALALVLPLVLSVAWSPSPGASGDPKPRARTMGRVRLEPCRRPRLDGWALCGRWTVWEDREERTGRRIALHLAVLPATGEDPLPDPLFVFDGGPGQAASESAWWVAEDFAPLLRRRDIVLVDRRGTGGSNPLDCPGPTGKEDLQRYLDPLPPAAIRRCRDGLSEKADLTLYTTPIAVDDIDEVREALGFDRIDLFGDSYGSREAMVYTRRHPERVRSVILEAAVPPWRRSALEAARMAQRSMDRLLDDCMADDPCRTAYPGVREELGEVMARLEAGPARFTPGDGGDTLILRHDLAAGTLRSLLVSPGGASRIPALIHAAHRGEFAPLGAVAIRLRRLTPTVLSRGLFLSVICAEEMSRVDSAGAEEAARGTFWGPGWALGLKAQCADWPRGRLPAGFFRPFRSVVPVLVLQGWLDPIGPPAWALELPEHFPNARVVIVRKGHHNFPTEGCVDRIMARFVDALDARDLDAACVADVERPAFALPGDLP